jgi:tRNA(adenine34) deaminase
LTDQKKVETAMNCSFIRTLNRLAFIPALTLLLLFCTFAGSQQKSPAPDPDEIAKRIDAFVPDKRYPDDPFVLVAVKEALAGVRESNGAVGACLVEESTGKIIEVGHNRQFVPYFRSDLHAEMDLLTRYEDRIRAPRMKNSSIPQEEQRNVTGLVLYTSVEPCPMCLSRIINMRLQKTYYAAPDPTGGMAHKLQDLPEFWRELASGKIFEPARCSPELVEIAKALFKPMAGGK